MALAPGRSVVVGNSVGGFAAGRLAIRRPELVRGLVIVDSGGFGGRPPQVRAFCALMSRPGFLRRIYPASQSATCARRSDADRRTRDAGIATTRREPGLKAVAELWGSFASPERDLRAVRGFDLVAYAGGLGPARPRHPAALGRHAAASIPGARACDARYRPLAEASDPEGFAAQLDPVRRRCLHGAGGAHERGAPLALALLGEQRRLELDGGVLEYFERGEGPALLFSHGWLANANLWRRSSRVAGEFRAWPSTCRSAPTAGRWRDADLSPPAWPA